MNFTEKYTEVFQKIEQQILIESELFLNELSAYSSKTEKLNKKLIKTTEGGKRIRGFLVYLGYEICGGIDEKIALKGSVAYEIFQSAILIHDDIIDKSPTRRGEPTIHFSLGDNQYGISQAICLGDIGFFWSIRLLNSVNLEEKAKTKAVNEFLNVMIKTGVGEILDVETLFFKEINRSDIDAIHYFKTAEYSIIGPLKLGAIMANAESEVLISLENIGRSLGLAYQIKDDILGVFSKEEITGKLTSTDIQEKKITHMYLFALENSSKIDKEALLSVYNKSLISEEDISLVKAIFTRSGALDASNKLIADYIESAKKSIETSLISAEFKAILISFSDFLQNRKY